MFRLAGKRLLALAQTRIDAARWNGQRVVAADASRLRVSTRSNAELAADHYALALFLPGAKLTLHVSLHTADRSERQMLFEALDELGAGMVSQANFQALAKSGGKYLMAMPMRRGDELTEAVLPRPGRYRKLAENLAVKELVGDGERRRRYAVCFNPQEARRQRAYRQERIDDLEAELASLSDQGEAGHSKRVCALRSSARYGRLLKDTKQGLAIDREAIAELERFDGKFVVHSNDDTLTAEDMALGYKQQQCVEEAWRTMKSALRMHPVFHWAQHRIHAHIAITVLSLLLKRVIEHACQDTWRNVRDDLKRIQLAQLSSPNGTVWQITDPTVEAANRLKALKIKPPPAILKLD